MRVVFVHGIGATAKVFEKTEKAVGKQFSCSSIGFQDRFGHPEQQVFELSEFLRQFKNEKIALVCHSMGGLVARKYLAKHPANHNVSKLILLGTPNLGILSFKYNFVPLLLEITAAIVALAIENYWILLVTLIASAFDFFAYWRGVKLLSKAVDAMKPGSKFLKDLNSQKLPINVEYTAILSQTWYLKNGDGAVSLDSQKLSEKCVPNFKELKYKESSINAPHFAEPKAADAILSALQTA